jgi:hypothetical protein
MKFTQELELSLRYLKSDEALRNLEADAYWPKWNSPWWHMLLLYEMGLVHEIPKSVVSAYVEAINKMPLKIFPIQPEDTPEGVDPSRGSFCHCQVGNVYQVLFAHGVDVDQEAPWMRPWVLRYQMADGGLNCDNEAYLIKNEVPSSMVGTISAFDSVLISTKRPWTKDESLFLKKGADFLIERKLMHGSSTKHNADERSDEEEWLKPCFPRFYLYDVLRGLNALLLWAEKTNSSIPTEAVEAVVKYLDNRFPDGLVRNERHSYEDTGTLLQSPSGEWLRRQPATFFPLLTRVSAIGEISPHLSKQWSEAKSRLRKHKNLSVLLTAG